MRTVKVRILPPQPNFLLRIAVKLASADLTLILIPLNFNVFPPTQYLFTEGEIMSRRGQDADCRDWFLPTAGPCRGRLSSGYASQCRTCSGESQDLKPSYKRMTALPRRPPLRSFSSI